MLAVYISAGICMGLGAIGSAVGEGYAANQAAGAIARQPHSRDIILRNMLIGQAMAETAGVFALIMAILLIAVKSGTGFACSMGLIGAGIAAGASAIGAGVGSGFVAGKAVAGIGRNPQLAGPLVIDMLIAQAFSQTPNIFGLLVALWLWLLTFPNAAADALTGSDAIVAGAAFLAGGICMGFGAVGPSFGTGFAGGEACEAVARKPDARSAIMRVFFIGGAVSQSTSVYSLAIAMIMVMAGSS